jgi:hypothetical protein
VSTRFGLVFWVKCLLTVVVVLGAAAAIKTIKGGPTLPHDRLVRAGDATAATSRYRVEIQYGLSAEALKPVAQVDVNAPQDFNVRMQSDNGITDLLAVQDRVYARHRQFIVDDAPWSGPSPRGLTMYPALGPLFFPATAVQAIYAVYDAEEVGRELLEGIPVVHYRGKVNPAYAYQRAYALWLVRTKRARPIKEPSLGSSPPTLAWVQKFAPSLRGRLDTQDAALSFFVRHPATVDVWVHPKDMVAYLVEITLPREAAEAGLPAGVIRFRFRDFNHEFDVSPFPRYPELPEPPAQ